MFFNLFGFFNRYHRQPSFSWEYKQGENKNENNGADNKSIEVNNEKDRKDEDTSMNLEEKKAEAAAEVAALRQAKQHSNNFEHHHHHHYHQSRFDISNLQEKEQQQQFYQEDREQNQEIQQNFNDNTTEKIEYVSTEETTKQSDGKAEIKNFEAEQPADETISQLNPIVVYESSKSYDKQNHNNEEKWAPANYEFRYEVNDETTGDIKHHEEKAVEGKITGEYALLDADGMTRIVKYTADDENGFLADVTREEASHKTAVH